MSNDEEKPRQVFARKLSTFRPRHQEWLIEDFIPLGGLTLLGGFEGHGKGFYTTFLAAAVTKGECVGKYRGIPKGVLIYSTEDDVNVVLRARMKAAGADEDRIHVLQPKHMGTDIGLDLSQDMEDIKDLCKRHDVGLIIIDPLSSSLAATIKDTDDTQLRRALEPLNTFAARQKLGLIGIKHYNKRETDDASMLMSGLRVWSGVARAVIGAYMIKGTSEFFVGAVKNSYGPKLDYCFSGEIITEMVHFPGVSRVFKTARIEWASNRPGEFNDNLENIKNTKRQERADKDVEALKLFIGDRTRILAADMQTFRENNHIGVKRFAAVAEAAGFQYDGSARPRCWVEIETLEN